MMNELKKTLAENVTARTENGAVGYERHASPFVTFFYGVSSMRTAGADEILKKFNECVTEDEELAYRMLFFVRDVRGGLGERRVFREILENTETDMFGKIAALVPEYGCWNDLMCFLDDKYSEKFGIVHGIISKQLREDSVKMRENKPCSLLAKWMPSAHKVSQTAMIRARNFYSKTELSQQDYRQLISALRKHIRVVETQMCAGQWGDINYSTVPSKANLNYSKAFMKHDRERRTEFLNALSAGDKTVKINAGTLFPHEIVHRYHSAFLYGKDASLEEMWNALPVPAGCMSNAIVIRDGSGSMETRISDASGVTALDVATSLSVLLSQQLHGEFKDKFITFSAKPEYVDLSRCKSLFGKLKVSYRYGDCSNTNIEKTFDLILRTAVENHIPQSEIPSLVIISDMEFDCAVGRNDDVLFKVISEKWENAGYELPRLVFWNVCSRTNAVPMQENKNGIVLVSGFSQSIFDMVMGGKSLEDGIREKICVKRYDAVADAINGKV